ncbi:hypothetical protein [Rhodospirillum rubrum]|nr:hypothetical protein [Rhodospirillum rubrum]
MQTSTFTTAGGFTISSCLRPLAGADGAFEALIVLNKCTICFS